VPERKLFFSPHSVNTVLSTPRSRGIARRPRAAPRTRVSPLKPGVVLFAGKLVADKAAEGTARGLSRSARHPPRAPDRRRWRGKNRAARTGATAPAGTVHSGLRQSKRNAAIYLLADLFVLRRAGHYETWGLAVNESMHMGTPALVSERVGCQRDLVTEGETGWVFKPTNPPRSKQNSPAPLAALADPATRRRLRENVTARSRLYLRANFGGPFRGAREHSATLQSPA